MTPAIPRSLFRRHTSSAARTRPRASADRAVPLSKRALDLAIAVPALLAAAPIILAAALLVCLSSPGPAFFRQTRIGHRERPFSMFKLRTMRADSDDAAFREYNTRELLGQAKPGSDRIFKLEADPRMTPVGRILRRTSIDELPQLLNVIRGEMSLVGPRPSLPWEVELYSPEQRRRHQCLPGITGLWQVSGRNHLSMPEMLALDLAYLERRSLWLDLQIMWRTPRAVLFDHSTR